MARSIAGLFHDRSGAEAAIQDLKVAGFDASRMGIVTQDKAANRELAEEHGTRSTEGAVTGGVIGGSIGALLAATGALVIPGIGPFISGGILATSVLGGAAGWLVGGLAGIGIPKEEAEYYESEVQQGRTLVTVDAAGRDAEARSILLRNGAEDLQDKGFGGGYDATATTQTTQTTMAAPVAEQVTTRRDTMTTNTENDIRVPVVEEELVAGKRMQEEGRVHIRKDVVSEQQTVSVPVTREEVHIERMAVTGAYDANTTDAFQERDIEVPLMGEEVVVGKRAHVVEEVRLRKDQVTENEQVSDTVRKERVVVEGAEETTGMRTEGTRTTSTAGDTARGASDGIGGAIRNAAETVKDKVQDAGSALGDTARNTTNR